MLADLYYTLSELRFCTETFPGLSLSLRDSVPWAISTTPPSETIMKELTCLELSIVAAGMDNNQDTVEFKNWYKRDMRPREVCRTITAILAIVGFMFLTPVPYVLFPIIGGKRLEF